MKVTINLATRPFVELRQIFLRLRIAMAALALLAVVLGIWLQALAAQGRTQQRKLDVLNAQADRLLQERAANEARMRLPQNAGVLERSQFLNDLFAHKSFSWTAVMMDLEQMLPAGVQVTSIEPLIGTTGEVQIRLRVIGDREKTVQLVRNLEGSKQFVAPRVSGETQQATEQNRGQLQAYGLTPGGVEFEIVSGYKPLPGHPKSAGKTAVMKTSARPGVETKRGAR